MLDTAVVRSSSLAEGEEGEEAEGEMLAESPAEGPNTLTKQDLVQLLAPAVSVSGGTSRQRVQLRPNRPWAGGPHSRPAKHAGIWDARPASRSQIHQLCL